MLTDGRRTDAGVTGILLAHPCAFGELKSDKMLSKPHILLLFLNLFNKFIKHEHSCTILYKQDQTLLWTCVAGAHHQCVYSQYEKFK